MNLLYNHYDIPIIEKEKDPYYSQSVVSLFYRLLWKNLMLFGEAGLNGPTTAKKGKALITGCLISLSRYIDLASGLYYYGKGFYTPYGCGFKRYTTDHGNEKGGYACLQFTPLPCWQLTTSGHIFATLSPKPQLATASSGYRCITRAHYTWSRATLFVMQHKLAKSPRNTPKEVDGSVKTERSTQNSLKCKIDHKLTHYWWTHAEAQYTRYTFLGQTHHGYALANTQKWKGMQWQFSLKSIYFKTQNYATRLYFYFIHPIHYIVAPSFSPTMAMA